MGAADSHRSDPLDRLNAVERELLILLGRGHTAKSIAVSKGLSVAAVNERFRAARRKTGLGSSREVARLLIAQENCHDFIDLASDPTALSNLPRHDAPPFRRASPLRRWRYPMLATGLLAVALLAQQTSAPPPPAPASATESQALVAESLARQTQALDMGALHAEAAGPPDPAWSRETEAALARRYSSALGPVDDFQSLGVTCSATLCEVAGATRTGLPIDQLTGLMNRLQSLESSERMSGLEQVFQHFGSAPDRPKGFTFVSYWKRRD